MLTQDGHIDPTALVTAYTTAAKQYGATIFEGVSVASIEQNGGAVTGLTTACGQVVKTPIIVNCTGAWARKIGSMAGVDLPLLAYKHAYVVTEPIPGLEGLPSIRDYNEAVYLLRGTLIPTKIHTQLCLHSPEQVHEDLRQCPAHRRLRDRPDPTED